MSLEREDIIDYLKQRGDGHIRVGMLSLLRSGDPRLAAIDDETLSERFLRATSVFGTGPREFAAVMDYLALGPQ